MDIPLPRDVQSLWELLTGKLNCCTQKGDARRYTEENARILLESHFGQDTDELGLSGAAVLAAGGVPVLAHLYYYQLSDEENLRLVRYFKELAGDAAAMEVEYGRYPRHIRDRLADMAREYGLMPSAGSDYHAQAAFETLNHRTPIDACRELADYIEQHC